ncbi:hypothetical protein ACFLVB_01415 [Chloroflexota bacterium]
MTAEYEKGQKVEVKPLGGQSMSIRDSELRQYVGLIGEIVDYFWISPPTGEDFYLYTVKFGTSNERVVLYADELSLVKQ